MLYYAQQICITFTCIIHIPIFIRLEWIFGADILVFVALFALLLFLNSSKVLVSINVPLKIIIKQQQQQK